MLGLTSAMMPFYLARTRIAHAQGDEVSVHNTWIRRWANLLLPTFGVTLHHTANDTALTADPPRGRGRLVIANHRSAIDIVVMQALFGGHLISRGDLSRWPLIGPAARAVGTLFLDRENARSGAATLRALEGWLREGRTVTLFPEGTTFRGDEVRPFHSAAFVAVARAGAEVVPVGLAYAEGSDASFVGESFGAHLMRVSAAPRIDLGVSVGAPQLLTDRQHAASFARTMRHTVQELVDRSRAHLSHEREAEAPTP